VRQLEQTTPGELLVPHFGRRNDVGQVFENTRTKVLQWVRETKDLKNKGMGLDEISEAMEAKIKSEAAAGDLPIYARVMVRTSVMGILHYLEKNP
jgi:hypothetical protein